MLISSSKTKHIKGEKTIRKSGFPYWTCTYFSIGEIEMWTAEQNISISADSFVLIPPNLANEFT